MSAISTHKKYLMDLKTRRNDPFYSNMANKQVRAIGGAFSEARGDLKQIYGREGVPTNAIAEVMQQATDKQVGAIENVYDQAQGSEELRRKQLEPQIEAGEAKLDELQAAKRRREREKKNSLTKGIMSAVGGAASFIPGVGPIISGALNTASGFVGGTDIGQIQQGVLDTVGAYTSMRSSQLNKKIGGKIGDVISEFPNLDKARQNQLLIGMQSLGAQPESLLDFLDNFNFGYAEL
jgi:hypothetical protein